MEHGGGTGVPRDLPLGTPWIYIIIFLSKPVQAKQNTDQWTEDH